MAVDIRHHRKPASDTPIFEQMSQWLKDHKGVTFEELIESMASRVSLVKPRPLPVMTPAQKIEGSRISLRIIDECPDFLSRADRMVAMEETHILPANHIRQLVGVAPARSFLIDDEEY